MRGNNGNADLHVVDTDVTEGGYAPIARPEDHLLDRAILRAVDSQLQALTMGSYFREWVAAENRRRLAAGLEPVREIPDRDDFDAPSELVWKLAAARSR